MQLLPQQDAGGQGANESAKISGAIPEEGKKWVGFDPTGLERAAKAARELNESCELILRIHDSMHKPVLSSWRSTFCI